MSEKRERKKVKERDREGKSLCSLCSAVENLPALGKEVDSLVHEEREYKKVDN